MEQRYSWRDWDRADFVNTATVAFEEHGLRAHGIQTCPDYEATWRLDASTGWVTRSISVEVRGRAGWSRSLLLERSETGLWTDRVSTNGTPPSELPRPGITDLDALATALDCDLGRCPLTNTMPIRRLGLLDQRVPKTPLIMAWIDMPSLQVIASDQYYSSSDNTHVRYVSGTRAVDVLLDVDRDAVVVTYPGLARRT